MKVTRDVVIDLWAVYSSGEASADTRALVEAFLRQDPQFANQLKDDSTATLLKPVPVRLSADHEMRTFVSLRRAHIQKDWPLFFAMLFSSFAFGRIVSDTSWDVSPRNFIVVASIAAIFWIVFFVRLVRRLAALR